MPSKSAFVPTILLLAALATTSAHAETTVSAAQFGNVHDLGGDGSFDLVSLNRMVVNSQPGTVIRVGVLEANVQLPPDGYGIDAVQLRLDVASYLSPNPHLEVIAYPGDGVIRLDDATALGIRVASFDGDSLGDGPVAIPLDRDVLEALLDGGSRISLRIQAATHPTSNWSIQSAGMGQPDPQIVLTATPRVRTVAIDVDPGRDREISLTSKKPLEVALLSDSGFDAASVPFATVALGDPYLTEGTDPLGISAEPLSSRTADVDGDGRRDVVFAFDVKEMAALGAIDSRTVALLLTGLTPEAFVEGADGVTVQSSGGGGKGNGKPKK